MSEGVFLTIVDGATLVPELRALLRPDGVTGGEGRGLKLPRFFYRVDGWQQAKETRLTAHFTLAELMSVDCHEDDRLLHEFPHYVPCAVSMLARYLEEFRHRADAPVFVSTNGGYRSPAHKLSHPGSPHCWAAAADIYRVDDEYLDDRNAIEKYARIAASIGPEVRVKPFGHGEGETDDHLHLDIGYITVVPHDRECPVS